MKPVRYDDDVPVFTSRDIEDYGMPDHYGYDNYIVIESREVHLVTDYKMEHSYDLIPIHRYSRVARFKTTLLKLVGEKSKIPDYIITACRVYLKKDSTDLWNDTRKILKCYRWSKYYDFIPAILCKLGLCRMLKITASKIEDILNDFKVLVERFEKTKTKYKRRYFPNIRFIVLKLLELHGCLHDYPIPFVRTERKLLSLSLLWEDLIKP
jgi:hypothetical protein